MGQGVRRGLYTADTSLFANLCKRLHLRLCANAFANASACQRVYTFAMFRAREPEKRITTIAVRVSQAELDAVQWMAERLAAKLGGKYIPSDVTREALREYYERHRAEAAAEEVVSTKPSTPTRPSQHVVRDGKSPGRKIRKP